MPFASVERAVADLRAGRLVIIFDGEERQNEGDLAMAADAVTPEAINFMARYGRGLICVPLLGQRLDELQVPSMVRDDQATKHGTAFAVSVEARRDVTTGISAHDRAVTIRALVDPATRPHDLARPGHTFPLRYREGGVLVRAGHTEAAIDLVRLAGRYPAAVICPIMGDDGHMARLPEIERLAAAHDMAVVSIAQVVEWRWRHERLVQRVGAQRLPTAFGTFTAVVYTSPYVSGECVALVLGDVAAGGPVLTRWHDGCLLGEIVGSLRCDCAERMQFALERIATEGRGVLLYARRATPVAPLHADFPAKPVLCVDAGQQDASTRERVEQTWALGAQVLRDLGVREVRLLTGDGSPEAAVERYGLRVVERLPLRPRAGPRRPARANEAVGCH
ncbi:MAG TPA: 3,4-dihydroxy-2-butanone-4-phosphate synthase [Chloroflexota bacterium]